MQQVLYSSIIRDVYEYDELALSFTFQNEYGVCLVPGFPLIEGTGLEYCLAFRIRKLTETEYYPDIELVRSDRTIRYSKHPRVIQHKQWHKFLL